MTGDIQAVDPNRRTEMMPIVPERARVVIIGGGIVGCSVAYHLAKEGWSDIVLLERKQLTSGTTWHAAGLIAQLRATANMTRLAKYSQELYGKLESETGIATGFVRTGSMTVALTHNRSQELSRSAAMARAFGVQIEEISPSEAVDLHPFLNRDGVVSAVYLEKDGQGDPSNIAHALAKGARRQGAKIFEGVSVSGFSVSGRRVTSVEWRGKDAAGSIQAEHVVNCAGMWAHSLGRKAGVNIPLHACEHFYMVTQPIEGLTRLPSLRVPDECAYYKEDAGKFLVGAFERQAKPWGMDGIPESFEFDQLPEDLDQFEPILEMAVERIPVLETAGVQTFFNGPESFTPDTAYLLGLAPERDNYFVAAGFNSIGIQSAGGAGLALARWIIDGDKPFDLGDVDIGRMQPFQGNKTYLFERVSESLGLLYDDHFPFRQRVTARGIRRSPLHQHLLERGGVMGEVAGWERANWFADDTQKPEYEYGWDRTNWFGNWEREHLAVRENVGVYDMSSFGKIQVAGPDAENFLNQICGANLSVSVGRIVYTQFLNEAGGIEGDVTVARISETVFLVVTPAATRIADQAWMRRHSDGFIVVITDLTCCEAVMAVMGPNSRKLMNAVSPNQFDNDTNPFGTFQHIEIGMGVARVHRISYVGELGWEIYVGADMAAHVFETILEAGSEFGLKLCGMHMMDSCRSEKGFRHFGHDITTEDHVLEAGLGFATDAKKPSFIGRDAILRKREIGFERRLVQFRLRNPQPLLYHNEPIVRDGQVVGYLTSGSYGHFLKGAIGLGYVPCTGESAAELLASSYQIDVAGRKIDADASLKPLYDPTGGRTRA